MCFSRKQPIFRRLRRAQFFHQNAQRDIFSKYPLREGYETLDWHARESTLWVPLKLTKRIFFVLRKSEIITTSILSDLTFIPQQSGFYSFFSARILTGHAHVMGCFLLKFFPLSWRPKKCNNFSGCVSTWRKVAAQGQLLHVKVAKY